MTFLREFILGSSKYLWRDNVAGRVFDSSLVEPDLDDWSALLTDPSTPLSGLGDHEGQDITAGQRVLRACPPSVDSMVNNGIWIGAAGAWTRAGDLPAAAIVTGGVARQGIDLAVAPARGRLGIPNSTLFADGDNFTLDDGTNPPVTFEFDSDASVVETDTLRAIDISSPLDADLMAAAIVTAIESAPTLLVSAFDGGGDDAVNGPWLITLLNEAGNGPDGNVPITDNVVTTRFSTLGMDQSALLFLAERVAIWNPTGEDIEVGVDPQRWVIVGYPTGDGTIDLDAASDVNIASLTGDQLVDGKLLTDGNTALLTAQTDPVENGVYVVGTPWVREPTFDESHEIEDILVRSLDGVKYGNRRWRLQNPNAKGVIVGTDPQTWELMNPYDGLDGAPLLARPVMGDIVPVASALGGDTAGSTVILVLPPATSPGKITILDMFSANQQKQALITLIGIQPDGSDSVNEFGAGVPVSLSGEGREFVAHSDGNGHWVVGGGESVVFTLEPEDIAG